MSTRERWIVYPLLFLTLGIALRDKVYPPAQFRAQAITSDEVTAGTVRCNRLEVALARCEIVQVVEPSGAERVRLAVASGRGGQVELFGRDGRPVVAAGADTRGRGGVLELSGQDGRPVVAAGADQSGRSGFLELSGRDGKPVLAAGADEAGESGVLETYTITGERQIQLRSTGGSGRVATFEKTRQAILVMGQDGKELGLFVDVPEAGGVVRLTLPYLLSAPAPDLKDPRPNR